MAPGARLELIQAAISAQERLLDYVFRVVFVARHAKGQAEDSAAVALDEHAKGVIIAAARPLHTRRVASDHPNL